MNKNKENKEKKEEEKEGNNLQLSFNSEHRLRSENLSWDIDVWYPLIINYTFKTIFIPLTLFEAKAIQSFHDITWRNMKKYLKKNEIEILLNLENDIDKKLKNEFKNGAFIRLCGRSPKDGEPLNKINIIKQYENNYQNILKLGYNKIITKMLAIAKTNYLKVYTGADVMSLLLTSERVYADMIDWIKYGEPEQICLRDWSPDMSMDYEFRVFICSDTITAISQYDHYCYYPHLESEKQFIKDGIESLWKKMHFRVGLSSYIMDVAYLPTNKEFIIIEFSPFFPCTGPALFNWTLDKNILEGREPFEFRIKTNDNLHPQIEDLLDCNWDDRWNQSLNSPPFYTYYETSEEEAFIEANSKISKKNRYLLIKIGIIYLYCCIIGIFTTFIYLIQLSIPNIINYSKINDNSHNIFITSFITSLIVFFSLHYILEKILIINKQENNNNNMNNNNNKEQKNSFQIIGNHTIDSSFTILFVYGTLKRNFQWNEKYLHNRGGNGAIFISTATTRDKHRLVVGDSGVPYLSLNTFLPDETIECKCNASSSLGNGTSSINTCTCTCESCQHNIHRPHRSWTGDTAATSLASTSIGILPSSHWSRSLLNRSPPLSTNNLINSLNDNTTTSTSTTTSTTLGERVHGEIWAVSPECLKNLDDYEGITKSYYERKRILVQLHDGSSTLVIANVYSIEKLPIHLTNGPFLEEYTLDIHHEFYRPIAHIQVKQLNYIHEPSTWGNVQNDKISTKGMDNVLN